MAILVMFSMKWWMRWLPGGYYISCNTRWYCDENGNDDFKIDIARKSNPNGSRWRHQMKLVRANAKELRDCIIRDPIERPNQYILTMNYMCSKTKQVPGTSLSYIEKLTKKKGNKRMFPIYFDASYPDGFPVKTGALRSFQCEFWVVQCAARP